MNVNEIVSSLPGEFGKEIIASVIVALTLGICGLAFRGIKSLFSNDNRKPHDYPQYNAPQPYSGNYQEGYNQNPYARQQYVAPPQNNGQAMWAVGLAFASYFFWFIVPLLAIPAILISLWLGFSSRRQTAGKVALAASCFHIVMLVCGIIFLIVYMLTASQSGYYYY